jgi:excisionase family DNA binding protein
MATTDVVSADSNGNEELSISAAASLLGISRPALVDLLESGAIPFRWIATSRRVRRAAVLEHQARNPDGASAHPRSRRSARFQALEEMTDTTDGLDLGYRSY